MQEELTIVSKRLTSDIKKELKELGQHSSLSEARLDATTTVLDAYESPGRSGRVRLPFCMHSLMTPRTGRAKVILEFGCSWKQSWICRLNAGSTAGIGSLHPSRQTRNG